MKKSLIICSILLIIALIYGAIFYFIGIASGVKFEKIALNKHFNNVIEDKSEVLDIITNKAEIQSLFKSPLKAIKQSLKIDKRVLLIISAILAVIILRRLFYFILFHEQIFNYLGFNKLIQDKKGTFGTARFADEGDIRKLKSEKTLENENGIILGSIKKPYKIGFLKKYNIRYRIALSPKAQMLNGHAIVVSGSGGGKTFSFVLTNGVNAIKDGVNVLFTDPKGELFMTLSRFYEKNGYIVRVLNLINIYKSDRFNPLDLVENELDVMIYIDVLFENARSLESTGVNDFWDTGAKDLMKALILYVKAKYPREKQNMGEVYDLITEAYDIRKMDILFSEIDDNTACKRAYKLYRAAEDKAREGIILGLGLKLQIFQHEDIRYLTSHTDMNMYDLKTKKAAFFLIMPDTHSSYNFIPSIFMNFLFIKLPHLHDNTSDEKIKNTRLRIFADEIANIGKIANLKNVITTLRSRKIDFFPIYQNIAQIKEMFGVGWETITGNCDTFITLGVNDEETSEYVSKKLGKQTIKVITKNKNDGLSDMTNIKRWSISEQERDLMQPSEVRELKVNRCICFIKGKEKLLLYKYGLNAMEEYKEIKSLEINIQDYIPVHLRAAEQNTLNEDNINQQNANKLEDNKVSPVGTVSSQVEINEKEKEQKSTGEKEYYLSKPVIKNEENIKAEETNQNEDKEDDYTVNDIIDIMDDDDIL